MRYVLLFALVTSAVAQNIRFDNIVLGPKGSVTSANVAVCGQPANINVTPCTPLASLCSSLTDTTCNQPNPLQSDALGNYHFYIPSTRLPVTIQIYGPKVAAPYVLTDQSAGNSISGGASFTATQGLQSIPPALSEVDIAADPSNTCDYNFNTLSPYGSAKICNNGTYLGVNYLGTGFTAFATFLPPSGPIATGSVAQFTSRGFFEVVPTPWPVNELAYCTGTVGVTNGGTYILAPAANGTSCTVQVVAEMPMSSACTASQFYANSSAAGGAAGSGLLVLYKNGATTAITCTMGTGTTCHDSTDTVGFNAGDTWSVRVTTGQATDTTANVRVSFLCQ